MGNCPFCGAESDQVFVKITFKCGTKFNQFYNSYEQSPQCCQNQIAKLQQEIADLKKRLEAWREYHAGRVEGDYYRGMKKLRDLGEI